MTRTQLDMLENAYQNNSDWSRDFVKQTAIRLGLNRVKVYKWHWDRKKKDLAGEPDAATIP